MIKYKSAISPVIAVILLLAISVVISMSMYSFLQDYTESATSSLSSNSIQGNVKVSHLFSNNLFLKSKENLNISLLRVIDSLGNELCNFSKNIGEINSTGLVGHWTFDDLYYNGSHYIVEDLSGNGNNGTLYDDNHSNSDGNTLPRLIKSNNGNALVFDGLDDYVQILDDNTLDLTDSLTILILFQFNKSNIYSDQGLLIKKENNLTNYALSYGYESKELKFNSRGSGGTSDGYGYFVFDDLISSKKLITLRFDSSIGASSVSSSNNGDEKDGFWKDGVSPAPNHLYSNSGYLKFGVGQHNLGYHQKFYSGEIDEIRIYNRTISDSEIINLYWDLSQNQQEGISQIDLSSCNLQKNQQYKITMIANGEKIESTQIVN